MKTSWELFCQRSHNSWHSTTLRASWTLGRAGAGSPAWAASTSSRGLLTPVGASADSIACSTNGGTSSFITSTKSSCFIAGGLHSDNGPSLPVTLRLMGPYELSPMLDSVGLELSGWPLGEAIGTSGGADSGKGGTASGSVSLASVAGGDTLTLDGSGARATADSSTSSSPKPEGGSAILWTLFRRIWLGQQVDELLTPDVALLDQVFDTQHFGLWRSHNMVFSSVVDGRICSGAHLSTCRRYSKT